MGMTKHELDKEIEANSVTRCPNCKYNYDSKFWELCEHHQTEIAEQDAQDQAFYHWLMAEEKGYGF